DLPQRRLLYAPARPPPSSPALARARHAHRHARRTGRRLVQLHPRSCPSALRRSDPPDRGVSRGRHMTPVILWSLITLQIIMGASDTLYHHELTERLAWRPSQQHELRLHAVRNLLYAALFLLLGWTETRGIFAMLVIAVLVAEVVVTLMDFVEEDMSRKLPASERINHTLLAVNYGAILALLVPVLLGWAGSATALVPVSYGAWSIVATVAAIGVALFGLRDLAAAARARRLVSAKPGDLMAALPGRQTVLVTGATGFIGRRLVESITAAGHLPIVLARDPAKAA